MSAIIHEMETDKRPQMPLAKVESAHGKGLQKDYLPCSPSRDKNHQGATDIRVAPGMTAAQRLARIHQFRRDKALRSAIYHSAKQHEKLFYNMKSTSITTSNQGPSI